MTAMNRVIKICGVRDLDGAIAAASAGATHLGFVFFKKSPRAIDAATAEEIATELKQASFERGFAMPGLVGLFVDAGESALAEAAPFLTHFQFHGHESPDRCAAMRAEFGLEIIKAIPVGAAADLAAAAAFAEAADMILLDARPPKGADRPGGHGLAFDWAIAALYDAPPPFVLAGGLAPETVAAAIRAASSSRSFLVVDVSSGVERAPGVKDSARVRAFIDAARSA